MSEHAFAWGWEVKVFKKRSGQVLVAVGAGQYAYVTLEAPFSRYFVFVLR